jgi:hypothetical protein
MPCGGGRASERKARLADRPKLSEAEKIAKLEAQLAKRKALLATGSSTPAAQPLDDGKERTRIVNAAKAAATLVTKPAKRK